MRAGRFIPIHFVPICDGASFIGGLIEALTFQNGKRRADYWNRVSVSMEQVAGKWAKSAEAQMLIDGALGFCGIHGEGSSDAPASRSETEQSSSPRHRQSSKAERTWRACPGRQI